MEKFKGTKGKWIVNLGDVYSEYQGDDEIICEIYKHDSKESQANALLISKAPEMLEMLEECLQLTEALNPKSRISNKIRELIKEATEL